MHESPSVFPAITICNLFPFNWETQNATLTKILTDQKVSTTITPSDTHPAIYQVQNIQNLLKSKVLKEYKNNSRSLQSMGFSLSQILISCYFNGILCNAANFSWFYSFEYGNCYIFNAANNSNTPLTTSEVGPDSGLQLELFSGVPGADDSFVEKSGFYVAVHNNSYLPLTHFQGFKISSGTVTEVGVKRKFYESLGPPYDNCRLDISVTPTDSIYYQLTSQLTTYSQKLCLDICLQKLFIYPICGCNDPSIIITNTADNLCDNSTSINCVTSVRNNYDEYNILTTCIQYCPLECNTSQISYTISTAQYPTSYYYNILSKQPNFILKVGAKTSINSLSSIPCMLKVFYQDSTYEDIAESPAVNVNTLLANIGIYCFFQSI